MNQIPPSIQRDVMFIVEQTKCTVHGEHPNVTFTPEGFDISCCCEDFRKETIKKCEDALEQALHEYIMNAFKGLM